MKRSPSLFASPHDEAGVTLLELIVVVGIIAILAAMVVPSVTGALSSGRAANKTADLREMTVAIVRHYQENRSFPALGAMPVVPVRDTDGDGIVRIALQTGAPAGQGPLPSNIDVICAATDSMDLGDAIARCFAPIDVAALLDLVDSRPQHMNEDATLPDGSVPAYDGNQSTPDWQGESLNLAGLGVWIYVVDDGGPAGTPFPSGALPVWVLDRDGKPWVLKNNGQYGR